MLTLFLDIATAPATEVGAVDFTWLFIKMMVALVIVCFLAVVILKYAVPRVGLFKKYSSSKYITVIARHMLEQKRSLYIVKVGSRYMLLGSSEHSVNLIRELDEKDVEG